MNQIAMQAVQAAVTLFSLGTKVLYIGKQLSVSILVNIITNHPV